ncbi:MAG: CRTAC1 family protein [Fidelibacterota bacterium]|nr:MAG: CRTAC1 family protein [Candidatus Neomarinimicrobiota bacterium]
MSDPPSILTAFIAEQRLHRMSRVAALNAGIAFLIIWIINSALDYLRVPMWVVATIILLLIGFGCDQSRTGDIQTNATTSEPFFTEITDQSQLHFVHNPVVDSSHYMPESIGSGGAFLDYDNDGDLDIYLINTAWRGEPGVIDQPWTNHLFRQDSGITFVDVTEPSGLGDAGYGMGVAAGDIDNDGHVDVYVTNYGPDALYRNNGDGTFANITESAGIDNPAWGCSAAMLDYNLDGFLDIYVANYVLYDTAVTCAYQDGLPDYCGPNPFPGIPDKLFRNEGDGTFTDVSQSSGIAKGAGKGLGVISVDFNGDHYPDIYVTNDMEANELWINQRDGSFLDEALKRGVALDKMGQVQASMGVAMGDIDGDDNIDLFITHLRNESNTLYRYVEAAGFQDETSSAGLVGMSMPYTGFGTGFFDYDHDGDLDLALVNGRVTRGDLLVKEKAPNYWDDYSEPNLLFENVGSGRFRNASGRAGLFSSRIETSRGLAFGDVDNDGDIDLLVINEGGRARLYRNEVPGKGHWLMLRAMDPALQRDAIGAIITVIADSRRFSRQVAPGYGFLASHDPRVHFGLDSAVVVDKIEVLWPGGMREFFPVDSVDQFITLEKGQGIRKSES